MARTKWIHVYDKDDGKYVGFFVDQASLNAWLKADGKGRNLEVTDRRPTPQQTQDVDKGLAAALTAVQEAEEAANAVPATGQTG